MATAPPIVRQGPDFDNYSTNVDFYYQNAMDRPADASNPPEAFSALYNSRAVSKRARSSDEEDALTEAAPAIEDDGRKKRSRGRPRLDTKDETAADVSLYLPHPVLSLPDTRAPAAADTNPACPAGVPSSQRYSNYYSGATSQGARESQ